MRFAHDGPPDPASSPSAAVLIVGIAFLFGVATVRCGNGYAEDVRFCAARAAEEGFVYEETRGEVWPREDEVEFFDDCLAR